MIEAPTTYPVALFDETSAYLVQPQQHLFALGLFGKELTKYGRNRPEKLNNANVSEQGNGKGFPYRYSTRTDPRRNASCG
jgi:hypothetical protein